MTQLLHRELTDKIVKAFYHVYNTLGSGFLEKVYENALIVTLRKTGLETVQQMPITVFFEGENVGEFFADLLVGQRVMVEIKVAETICEAHEAQLMNYLRATRIEVGLILNFGPKAEFRRKVFSNQRKTAAIDDAPF